MSSSDRTEQQGNDVPDLDQRRTRGLGGRRTAPVTTSNRLPNRPPPSRQPKDTGLFPPLNQQKSAHPQETNPTFRSPTGLIDTTVTISTKTGQKYEGVVTSTSGEGGTTGVTLKNAKEISVPGAPVKDSIFIASTNIDTLVSGLVDVKAVNKDSKTETDDTPNSAPGVTSETHGDDVTGETPKRDTPKVPIHGPGGLTVTPQVTISNPKTPTPAISTGGGIDSAFREFVIAEKQRLLEKKAVSRVERDKLTSDFAKFSQTFKLKKPLVPTLAKDEEKQKRKPEKTDSDSTSENAGTIGGQASAPASTSGTHDQ